MIFTTIWEYFTVINDTKWADDTLNLSLSLTGLAEIFIIYSILDMPPPYKKAYDEKTNNNFWLRADYFTKLPYQPSVMENDKRYSMNKY